MMTTPQILRNSVLSIPVGVLAGACASWEDAGAALLSSIVCVANLWSLSILTERAIDALASQQGPEPLDGQEPGAEARGDGFASALWFGAIAAKFILLLLLYWGMLQVLPPFGLAMGFVPLMVGIFITGLLQARTQTSKER